MKCLIVGHKWKHFDYVGNTMTYNVYRCKVCGKWEVLDWQRIPHKRKKGGCLAIEEYEKSQKKRGNI